MTQCKEGMKLEDGTFLVCPQDEGGHDTHGPFKFMFHKGPTGAKHIGWHDDCSKFGCEFEYATTLVNNGSKRGSRPKGKGWTLDGISAASPSSVHHWRRPWPAKVPK